MEDDLVLKAHQKRMLHQLLMIKSDLGDVKSRRLEEYLNAMMAEMDAPDVAYVERMVAELLEKRLEK